MSQYSANQHSTETTIKPIAFKQNRINFLQQTFQKSGSIVKNNIHKCNQKAAINLLGKKLRTNSI
jgi:hypothetical protein